MKPLHETRVRPIGLLVAAILALAACSDSAGPTAPPAPQNPQPPAELHPFATVIDALMFNQGPRSSTFVGCAFRGFLNGFPRGTPVTVTVGSTIEQENYDNVQTIVGDLILLSGGDINAFVRRSTQVNPRPGSNEITLGEVDQATAIASCGIGAACGVTSYRTPIYPRGHYIQGPDVSPATSAHEIGHGFGLCHTNLGTDLMGAGLSISRQTGVLSPDERAAIEAIYSSPLAIGASRAEAEALGLVPPS